MDKDKQIRELEELAWDLLHQGALLGVGSKEKDGATYIDPMCMSVYEEAATYFTKKGWLKELAHGRHYEVLRKD